MDEQNQSLLCMLLLKEKSSLPDPEGVAARLREIGGSDYQLTWDDPAGSKDGIDAQFYNLEGRRVMVGLMPMPIPWTELEGPCAQNVVWPEATEVCRQHQAHLIVGLQGEPDPVDRHLMLTHFAAAMAQEAGALAVYWGSGGVVQSAELFGQFATEAEPESLPLLLWISFHKFMHEGAPFVATEGLKEFGVMEVEAGSANLKPMQLLEKVYDIAHYLCLRGPVLKDGDTVGASARERFLVRHLPSVMNREERVIRILFDQPKQSRGLLARLFKR